MGKAIIVEDADFSANSVGKITISGSVAPSPEVTQMYDNYLQLSGRKSAVPLRNLLAELQSANLLSKCTTLLYLASEESILQRIAYNIIDGRKIAADYMKPTISPLGSTGGWGVVIIDAAANYDVVNKGICVVTMSVREPLAIGREFAIGTT